MYYEMVEGVRQKHYCENEFKIIIIIRVAVSNIISSCFS